MQHLWRLGGPHSMRGYDRGEAVGETFWRGRAELGTQLPMACLLLFSDAGWEGSRDNFRSAPRLLSAGVGVSLLDGLLRLDLARALKAPTGWGLTAYFAAWL